MNLQLTLAARYLSGRKLRTFLTTLAIMFGVLVIFGMNLLIPAFINSFTANAMAMEGQVDAVITNRTRASFPVSVVDRIEAIDGIQSLSGTLERSINLPPDYYDRDASVPDRVSAVNLVGVNPQTYRSLNAINLVDGRWLIDEDRDAIVITESLAETAAVNLGDTLSVPTTIGEAEFQVVGILPQRLLPGNEELLVPLSYAQELLDAPGEINVIEANFDSLDADRRSATEAAIQAELGSTFAIGVIQPGAELLENIRIGQIVLDLFGVFALIMGGFIIFNTFRTIIAERRHDIGMLRAVGASRKTITGMILVEGLIQGVIGSAAGLIFGYLLAIVILKLVAPIGQMYLNIQVSSPVIRPAILVISVFIGVAVTTAASIVPARKASRITPIEALRPTIGEVNPRKMLDTRFWIGIVLVAIAVGTLVFGNASWIFAGGLFFIIGLILVIPALVYPVAQLFSRLISLLFVRDGTAYLAEGNINRQPDRTAVTASTTLIAIAVLVMAASIVSSIFLTFSNLLRDSLSSDFLIFPPAVMVWSTNVGASPDLTAELKSIEGVDVVSNVRYAGTIIDDVNTNVLGVSPSAFAELGGLTFTQGEPQQAFSDLGQGRNIILNGVSGSVLGVEVGDSIDLLTPNGEQTYQVVGLAWDYLNAKINTGYISQANIETDFGQSEDVFYQINASPDADLDAVETRIKSALAPYPQFNVVYNDEFVQQNIGLLDAMFFGLYALMAFLAIPSLIAMMNTLAIGVIERTREIGMLRAVGATRKQVRRMILSEALILAGIGVALGLLSGLYLGRMAIEGLILAGFPLDYIFPAQGIIAAVAVGLLFGALAAIIPARQASKMDVVAALRYE